MKIAVTADWHIRGEVPRCRQDEDWLESQRQDIRSILSQCESRGVDVLCIVGDIFHQSRAATEAVNMVIQELMPWRDRLYILPGNHDLPYHSYDLLEKSSIGTLLKTFRELGKDPFPIEIDAQPFGLDKPGVAPIRFVHRLVFPDAKARPIADCGQTAEEIAEEFKGNDIIICGDYHHSFIYTSPSGQTVINPGCINIQAADMADYFPKFYIVEVRDDLPKDRFPRPWTPSIDQVPIEPPPGQVIVTQYLALEKERDERMEKFLDKLPAHLQAVRAHGKLSFRDNLEAKMAAAPKEVQEILVELLSEVNSEKK